MSASSGASRRTVSVLFCDVVDSTVLGDALDPETLRRAQTEYYEAVREVLERHGGTVEKFIGDGVMAVFGLPILHEDDALRALHAASELRVAVAPLDQRLGDDHGLRWRIRVGVATGEVFAGDVEDAQSFATGPTVVVAERLEASAQPSEVLLDDATYRLTAGAALVEPVEPVPAKGKAEPVAAWRLVGVQSGVPGVPRRLDTPLVGRRAELASLRKAYDQAVAERRCRLASVIGPAGIGKSRLVREFLMQTAAEATIRVGRCPPYGEGVTFWPIAEVLPDATFEGTTEEIFRRVRKDLEDLARERPLVVCFDDVHWGEPTFLNLVDYLQGLVADAPVLVICMARPDVLDERPQWAAGGIFLAPLSSEEAEALLAALEAPAESRPRIAEAAEGNPLFAEQMAAMAAEQGRAFAVPPSIRALLAARLDRLPPEERAVVERAAVIGREFPLRAVTALAPDALRAEATGHLLALVRKELVEPYPWAFTADEDGFRFRHGLIREAAYESVPKELRAALHEQYAGWFERYSGEDVIIGYHLEQAVTLIAELGRRDAGTDVLAARAGALLGTAGQRAFGRGDMPAAARLLMRATVLLGSDERKRLELSSDLAAALADTGEPAQAESLLEQTIADAEKLGDPRLRARAELVRSAIRMQTLPEGAAEDVARVADEAIEVFTDAQDELGLAQAWSHLSRVHLISSRWGAAAEELEQALVHARKAGNRREEARILGQLALCMYWGPAPVPEAIERCERMLAETGRDRTVEALVTASIAALEAMRGSFGTARELYWRSREMLADLGLTPWIAAHTLALSFVETLAGDPGAAEEDLRYGVAVLDELGMRSSFSTLASALARTCFETGRSEEAEELVERARLAAAPDDVASEVLWRTTAARLRTANGDLDGAERHAREAVALAEQTDALNLHADSLVDLAGVLAARGGDAGADLSLAEAARLYRLKGNVISERRAVALRSTAVLD